MVKTAKKHLQHCLNLAWPHQGLTYPNPPVGALIVDEKENVIGKGAHEFAGGPHAEVNAIKDAYVFLSGDTKISKYSDAVSLHQYLEKHHNNFFEKCSIYVTLEPCSHHGRTLACADLIRSLGFAKVHVGTMDPNPQAAGGAEFLRRSGIDVTENINSNDMRELIEPFSIWQKKSFIFFKIALSANGVYEGGTISSLASRTHMHKLRDKVDLIVIGGRTVRTDRPTLDARLCNGNSPDILIYSHSKDFDRSIPLFQVSHRNVYIEDSLDIVQNYRFVMVEGGQELLRALAPNIDWYLEYRSSSDLNGKALQWPMKKRALYSQNIGDDTMSWYKKVE